MHDIDSDDQQSLEAARWAQEHAELLASCFERFQREKNWPKLDELQQDFDEQEVDVAALTNSLPALLGVVDQQRLELSVRGISEIPAASPLLESWATVLRLACARMTLDAFDRNITYGDMSAVCNGNRDQTACLLMIILRDSWPPRRGMGAGGSGYWIAFDDDVLALRNAQTVADILEIRGPVPSHPRPTFEGMFASLLDAQGEASKGGEGPQTSGNA